MLNRKKKELTLQPSYSTSSLNSLPSTPVARKHTYLAPKRVFEYEDLINIRKTSPQPFYKITDVLARESDVTISNKVTPLTEYKGYGMYLLVTLGHAVWIVWTFTPKWLLNMAGIYYYPSRWWSLSVSSLVLVGMLYTYIALQLWNMEIETVPLNDLRAIVDEDAVIENDVEKYGWQDTNGVFDLRITDVNKVLYD